MSFIEFLSNWILQITIFMLLAFLVDLLLPNTNLKQYVKLVIGILLIMIILEPLFSIFKIDTDHLVNQIVYSNQESNIENNIENEMKNKKSEIENLQSAYVLEEVLVQMKNKVEEELGERYETVIANIEVDREKDLEEEKIANFTSITVLLDKKMDSASKKVEEVSIQIGDSKSTSKSTETLEKTSEVKTFLAKEWGVETAIITVNWKEE